MAVQVDLVANSNVEAQAKKDAAAVKKLAAEEQSRNKAALTAEKLAAKESKTAAKLAEQQEKSRQRLFEKQAKETQKDIAAQLKAQVAKQKQDIKDGRAAVKAKQAFEKKQAAEVKKQQKLIEEAHKRALKEKQDRERKSLDTVKKIKEGNLAEAAGLGAVGVAGATVAAVLVAASVAAVALTVAIGAAATEARTLEMNSKAALDVLTAGRGSQALALLDGLAEELGMKFQDARDRFVEFRQAGADNTLSANLLKLTADLDTIDSSGKLAKEAIEKVLQHKNADGTLDIKTANKEMALLAKQAGVAGDGALAAEARFTTLGGALKSLDNSKVLFLQEIGEKIEPAINRAAGEVAKFVDKFLESKKGQKLIDDISNAVIKLADIVVASLPYIEAAFDGFMKGLELFKPVLDVISGALDKAFGGDKKDSLSSFKTVIEVVTVAVGGAMTALAALAAIAAAIPAAFFAAMNAGTILGEVLSGLAIDAFNWGKNIVLGVIKGISEFAGQLLGKVQGLANSIKDKFTAALRIQSPSKVFEQYGKFTAQGFGQGFEREAPDGGEMASGLVQAAAGPAAAPSAAAAPGGSGGPLIHIENLNVPAGANAQEFAVSIRRQLEAMLLEMGLARGSV